MDTSTATPTQRRERAIWRGSAAGLLSKALTAVCGLAQVPIALAYLGPDLFGLWMTLIGGLTLMNFADFGIGAGVQNQAGEYMGRDEADQARQVLVNGLAVLGGIALVVLVLLLAGWKFTPWTHWLKIPDASLAMEAQRGVFVLILLICINLPLTAVPRLAFGLQLGWLASTWMAVTSALTLGVVVAARGLKLDFAEFIVVATAPLLLGNLGLAVHLCRLRKWSWRDWPKPVKAEMRVLFRQGLPFTLPQLGALAFSSVPPMIISAVMGPAMVTPYHLCQRLLALFGVLQQIWLTQLWPAYTEANARGDFAWLKKTYVRSIMFTIVAVALPQFAFAGWGSTAVAVWTHDEVHIRWALALMFGLSAALGSLSQPPAFLLNSLNRIKGQSIYGMTTVVLALAFMPSALRHYGLIGAPAVAALAYAIVLIPLIYWEAARATISPGKTLR